MRGPGGLQRAAWSTTGVVVAEWLRRWTRIPSGSPRAGSNPAHNVQLFSTVLVQILSKPLVLRTFEMKEEMLMFNWRCHHNQVRISSESPIFDVQEVSDCLQLFIYHLLCHTVKQVLRRKCTSLQPCYNCHISNKVVLQLRHHHQLSSSRLKAQPLDLKCCLWENNILCS